MREDDLLVLRGPEVEFLLAGREAEIMSTVQRAYELHALGKTALPYSAFLRFPQDKSSRIIALPAYLGDGFEIAGLKWISSFPGNIAHGVDRASGVLILNSMRTGRPEAVIEASVINAKRTAASAALAARHLASDAPQETLGVIGCGVINFEIVRFIKVVYPGIKRLLLFDLDRARACIFQRRCLQAFDLETARIVSDLKTAMKSSTLISFATTAAAPHIFELPQCPPCATALHISLRDFAPEIILSCENIVDDSDHVCRAETSLDLAQQLMGNRDFIQASLASVMAGSYKPGTLPGSKLRIFSPFGLGILDIAVGALLRDLACQEQKGTIIGSFVSPCWQHGN